MSRWLDEMLAHDVKRPQRAFFEGTGVTMTEPHVGQLKAGGRRARVQLEPGDWLRLSAAVRHPPSPWEAMQVNHGLPGNLRFAQGPQDIELIADTQVDGQAHLPRTFDELRNGLAWTKRKPPAEKKAPPVEKSRLEQALEQLGWDEDRVVERDLGWELRPRLNGEPVPVRLDLDGSSVRVHRTVVATLPPDCRPAVASEALRLNSQVRFSRYACVESRLVAEVRLHAGIVEGRWLATAAHAVAVAARHAGGLQLLVDCEEVRRWYALVFKPDN